MKFVILFLAVPLFFCFVYVIEAWAGWMFERTKKEAAEDALVIQTRFPVRTRLFSVIVFVLTCVAFIFIDIGFILGPSREPAAWLALILFELFFTSILLLLMLSAYRTYEIIQEDGILVKRLIKTKFVPWSQMGSYSDSFNQIIVYDQNQKIVICIADNRVGMQAVLDQLSAHNIPKK